jgi:hypothetical protein
MDLFRDGVRFGTQGQTLIVLFKVKKIYNLNSLYLNFIFIN